jgi:hypothetical protein
VLARLLNAKGDCSDTSFKILGLTLAQASLLIFTAFTLILGALFRSPPGAGLIQPYEAESKSIPSAAGAAGRRGIAGRVRFSVSRAAAEATPLPCRFARSTTRCWRS